MTTKPTSRQSQAPGCSHGYTVYAGKHPNGKPCDDGHTCCYHVAAAKAVLADRERELLELKGPCSTTSCRLHYAHSGPCHPSRED